MKLKEPDNFYERMKEDLMELRGQWKKVKLLKCKVKRKKQGESQSSCWKGIYPFNSKRGGMPSPRLRSTAY